MSDQVYKDMIGVMSERSPMYGGMDAPEFFALVEELFTPEEAAINNAMPSGKFTAAELAEKMGGHESELAEKLKDMAGKGLCISLVKDGARVFKAAPFMPGIFEYGFYSGGETERDKKLAHLVHEYKEAWEANAPPLNIPYPMIRAIPV